MSSITSSNISHPGYFQFIDSGLAASAPLWFAVQTKPRHEKKVSEILTEKGIQNFLPLFRAKRQWADRWKWIELPLFSQYIFVRISGSVECRVRVLRTNGVFRLAGESGRGTAIPDEQIADLHTIVNQKIPSSPCDGVRIGQRIRIRGGALNGIEGILAAVENDRSLVISIDLIQKSVAIRIEGFEVEAVSGNPA
jgi:transcription antitermination factor NusG